MYACIAHRKCVCHAQVTPVNQHSLSFSTASEYGHDLKCTLIMMTLWYAIILQSGGIIVLVATIYMKKNMQCNNSTTANYCVL